MPTDPTPEQIAKLPQWAQQYINKIDGERFQAVRALKRFEDKQTPSTAWYDEFMSIGEGKGGKGPTTHRFYIPATRLGFSVAKSANGDPVEVWIYHNEEEQRLELTLPRDFCHMHAFGPGQLHIVHSPYDPFFKKKK
jgi:hypothetical protein